MTGTPQRMYLSTGVDCHRWDCEDLEQRWVAQPEVTANDEPYEPCNRNPYVPPKEVVRPAKFWWRGLLSKNFAGSWLRAHSGPNPFAATDGRMRTWASSRKLCAMAEFVALGLSCELISSVDDLLSEFWDKTLGMHRVWHTIGILGVFFTHSNERHTLW